MPTPTSSIQYPLVNGVRHSFASIEVKFVTQTQFTQIYFVREVNYKRTRSRTKLRLNHPDPVAKTIGSNDYDGNVVMALAEWQKFVTEALGGPGYGDVMFEMQVTYTTPLFDTIVDSVLGCTMDSTEVALAQNDDALVRPFDLSPLKVLFNGVDDLANPLQPPPTS